MKEIIKKYLTQRNRNIISIIVIVLGLSFIINYCFFEPTYINSYIASNVYMAPANSAFDDENFYKCVVDAYNKKNNKSVAYTTSLSDSELKTITSLTCYNKQIASINGIEKITKLISLDVFKNQLTELDVSQNPELKNLSVWENQLTKLDVSNNTKLEDLDVQGNQLTSLDVSKNTALIDLDVSENQLFELDVSKNIVLKSLRPDHNELTKLDVSKNTALTDLNVSYNQLTSLDVSKNTALIDFNVSDNQLTQLDVSKNSQLTTLSVYENQLTELDVSQNPELKNLSVWENQLTELDVSQTPGLKNLSVWENQLTKLNVSQNIALESLTVSGNQLTQLDISKNVALESLNVSENQLFELDVSKNIVLKSLRAEDNELTKLDVSNNPELKTLYAYGNQLIELDLSQNPNLVGLYLSLDGEGNQLTELDVSNNIELKYLIAHNNQLTKLNLGKNSQLKELDVYGNQLTELDVSQTPALKTLYAYRNQLTELDVSQNELLESLRVDNNQLTKLDVSQNLELKTLYVSGNQLTELDVSKNILLKELKVGANQLTELDLSKNVLLEDLFVGNNQLTSLDVSKNTVLTSLGVTGNPFGREYYMYKNINGVKITNPVKIPSHLNWDEPIWNSKNTDIAMVDENGLIKLLKVGTVEVSGYGKYSTGYRSYEVTNTINVVEITSDKYIIDEDNNYIFVGSDNDIDVIKSNIKKSSDDIDVDIDMDKYKLYVKHEDEVLKEFDIIGLSSKDYDLSKEYIYVKDGKLDLELINNKNCDKSIEDNKLVIKHGDNVLYEYKLISISSNYYDIKGYIYIGTKDEVDIDKITVINGELSLDNNKLIIKYKDEIVDEIDIVSIKIDIDKIFDKHIYIGHKLDLSKVKTINCTPYVNGNMLFIKYNNKFSVDTYNLLYFDVRDYNIYGNNIVVLNDVSYDDFTSKINKSDEITYKIYNGEEVVTSGNITIGMEVRIYYEKLIDTYMITDKNEYVEINDLEVDEENKVINNINVGSSIDSIISNINTSGNVKVYDEEDELVEDNSKNIGTGWKIKIELTDSKLEYVVSVKGDLNGDGKTNINDVIKVAKYIANSNALVGIEYTNAADVNLDGKININDAIRLAKGLANFN